MSVLHFLDELWLGRTFLIHSDIGVGFCRCTKTDVRTDFAGQQRGGDGAESDWRNQYEILDLAPRYWQAVEYPGKFTSGSWKISPVVSKRKIITFTKPSWLWLASTCECSIRWYQTDELKIEKVISETPLGDLQLQVVGRSSSPTKGRSGTSRVEPDIQRTWALGLSVKPHQCLVEGRNTWRFFFWFRAKPKKSVKNPSPTPTKNLGWVNRPEAMNPAYYLTTLNCKQTLLGDDLPDPLAGVTLGEVLVVEMLEIFGWKLQAKLRWNLKISSKWKGHIFWNQQFFGFMWNFIWKVYFFFGGKHRCESIPSFPTRYWGMTWPRRVPGIENMVTTGIWAFKRPWFFGGPAFTSAAEMHRGYDVVETEPGRFEMVLPIEYPGVTIHGWKISEMKLAVFFFFLGGGSWGKYTFDWPTRAFNSRVKVLMPEKFSVSELYLFFE